MGHAVGQPWFVAADVCRVLKHQNTSVALKALGADEKAKADLGLPGQPPSIISESGLYKLVMRSDKPEARALQDWVTRDVLPAIRKDGAYIMGEEKVAAGEMDEDEFVLKAISILQRKVERITAERDAAQREHSGCFEANVKVNL
ncbi:MAG: BRO family protein [Paracoccaceae bacterium]